MPSNETIHIPEWEYLDRLSTAYAIAVSKHIYDTEKRELTKSELDELNSKAMEYAKGDLDLSRRIEKMSDKNSINSPFHQSAKARNDQRLDDMEKIGGG